MPDPTVPLSDLPIRVASGLSPEDEVHYLRTFGPVLAAFPQITVTDYWQLTATEHASLLQVIGGENGDIA